MSKRDNEVFSKLFPYVVEIRDDVTDEAWRWCNIRVKAQSYDFAWFTKKSVGFKNKQIAVEFKLIYG